MGRNSANKLKTDFDLQMKNFTSSGILTRSLLKCLWAEREFTEETYEKMEELLQMLDLCYKETIPLGNGDKKIMFRFPWFLQDADEKYNQYVTTQWGSNVPFTMLQYTICYQFSHRIPSTIYERFCVRLQRHLQPGFCI